MRLLFTGLLAAALAAYGARAMAEGEEEAEEKPAVAGMECTDDAARATERAFLVSAAGYDIAALIPALFLLRHLRRIGWKDSVLRLFVPVVLFAAVATGLAAWHPFQDEWLQVCMADSEMLQSLVVSGMGRLPRGLVAGGLPTLVLYFTVYGVRQAIA